MNIAIISDIHGNIQFLKYCLKMIDDRCVDKIVALGDYFGYMQDGKSVINELRRRNALLIKGNHEAMLLGELPLDTQKDEIYGLKNDKNNLCNDELTFIKNLNEKVVLNKDGLNMLFVHGSPMSPLTGYVYENNVVDICKEGILRYDYIFMGHAHRAFVKKYNYTTFVNVGSCGLPRDHGLKPCVCIFNTLTRKIDMVRVKIDREILNNDKYKDLDASIMNVFLR